MPDPIPGSAIRGLVFALLFEGAALFGLCLLGLAVGIAIGVLT